MEKSGSKNVLITGGTGLIGSHLTGFLINKGYNVAYVSRSSTTERNIKVFQWDLDSDYFESGAVQWSDYIIHLAGAGIADKRWTEKRKKELRDSRVKTADLLVKKLQSETHNVKALISASGVGYYGDTGNRWVDENSPPSDDFLGKTSAAWENSVQKAEKFGIRVCCLRTAMVLAKTGGALKELARPVKYYVGASLGSGKQYMPWIHIEDLCAVYLKAIEDKEMQGVYNAVAPNPVTNKEFMKTLGEALERPVFLPPVPKFALKLFLGEMADVVLISSRVSNQKLIDSGFQFRYNHLMETLENIY